MTHTTRWINNPTRGTRQPDIKIKGWKLNYVETTLGHLPRFVDTKSFDESQKMITK